MRRLRCTARASIPASWSPSCWRTSGDSSRCHCRRARRWPPSRWWRVRRRSPLPPPRRRRGWRSATSRRTARRSRRASHCSRRCSRSDWRGGGGGRGGGGARGRAGEVDGLEERLALVEEGVRRRGAIALGLCVLLCTRAALDLHEGALEVALDRARAATEVSAESEFSVLRAESLVLLAAALRERGD